DLCGAAGDLGAGAQGFGGDAFVVGRDDHAVDAGAGLRGVDGAGQQRDPRDLLEVLQWDPLGTAAGGDDRDRPMWGGGCGFGSRRKVIHNDSTLTTRCYL